MEHMSEKVNALVSGGLLQFQQGRWIMKDGVVYENCLSCPSHEVINDPDPDDTFCDDDKAVVCHLMENDKIVRNSKYLSERSLYKVVEPSIRPYNLKNEAVCPDWCPLHKCG